MGGLDVWQTNSGKLWELCFCKRILEVVFEENMADEIKKKEM